MSAGCCSWCPLFRGQGDRKQTTKRPKDPAALVPATTAIENIAIEPKTNEKPSLSVVPASRSLVPPKPGYVTASGKQALALLQAAASVLPVPFLQDAVGVALKIIEVCEDASAVETNVKELQDRVCHLMVVIVDTVTAQNEEGSGEAVVRAAKNIERDIKDLLSTLTTINKELMHVREQNRWLTVFYKDLNMSPIQSCLDRLSTALERFKLANDLRDSELLQELHSRLEKIQLLTQQMAEKVVDIHEDVKEMQEDVKDIKQILAKTRRVSTPNPSSAATRHQIPLKPEIFHGRDELVEEVAQSLTKEETSRVCILGPGGMGKTSVLLAVAESPLIKARFPPGNCVWVPCIEATSATQFLEILYLQLQVPGDKQVTLDKIIFELDASKEPRLLLLDNFETPWYTPGKTQKQVGDILRTLANLTHVAMLITMRGRYPPCDKAIKWQSKNIRPTDEAACLRIYHDINPDSENDPDVPRLLDTLGHMPFAVTLMANLGKEGQSTAKELLDAWSKFGPDILPDELEQSMNRSISLSVDSDLVKRNPNALLLLKILSLLPAGTTKENLRWWAPTLDISMIPSAIATLSHSALLVENRQQDSHTPILFVVPVVQSFMQQQGRVTDEIREQIQSSCCQFVLDHACRFDDPTFSDKSKALAAEDTNIQSIVFASGSATDPSIHSSPRTVEALIAFCWYRCDTKPNPEIANHAVTVAEASGIKKYIASAVWCVGRTYNQLANHTVSYDHLLKAYQLFNALPADDLASQRLGGQCGIDLADTARLAFKFIDKSKAVSLGRDVEKKCATLSDDLIHGRSLVYLGIALQEAQQDDEALVYLDRATIMLKRINNLPNLAEACEMIAWLHYCKRRLPEALAMIDEAWTHAELTDSQFIHGTISLDVGTMNFSADNDTKAWKFMEIALTKASHVGNRLGIARALQSMGYGYLRRGDYENAYGAYEAAAETFIGTIEAWVEKRCKDNMARIREKQSNPYVVIAFERPAYGIEFDGSLFYPPVPRSASETSISSS